MKRFFAAMLVASTLAISALGQDMSTNWKHNSDRTKCEDLQITSSDYEIARSEQTFSIEAAQESQVTLSGSKNGGIYISGWEQPNYQVIACKAGFGETTAEAKQVVDGVNVSSSGGNVTTTGPDQKHWAVHFIIRVPHNANLKADTYNGPVSLRDADGKMELRSHNGPLSVKHFNGDLTGETTNGPVSFAGTKGNINLATTNGPVSLDLESSQYSGELSASTTNGPVTLHVPEGFNSAFVVEGGWGPMNCSSSICSKANVTRERGFKRVEFGDSPKIKASTHNGPVSISGSKDDL